LETVNKLLLKTVDADNEKVIASENNTYLLTKPLTDETTISDVITISVIKTLTDDALPEDNTSFLLSRLDSDGVVASDINLGGGTQDYTDALGALGYFLESYTENSATTETTAISFS
jgi:hypothetical protein